MKKKYSTKGLDALLAKIERQNSYEKPEYEEMSPSARSWLLPFWNVEPDDKFHSFQAWHCP